MNTLLPMRVKLTWFTTIITPKLQGGLYTKSTYNMVGLKGNIYFATTTLILYQARAGKVRVGGSELLSNKNMGLPAPTR